MTDPVGFDLGTPRASWVVEDTQGTCQKAARIEVSCDKEFRELIWDSGMGNISSLGTEIGIELKPYRRYYWRVTVIADNGESAVSSINFFETAKLDEPWKAEWITVPKELTTENPVFETSFIYENERASQPESSGSVRLYVCGLGLYTAYLNGKRIGNERLTPGCNDYNMWLQYQTYELDVKPGVNVLKISLGNGWYKGRFGPSNRINNYGDAFHLIAEVREDGRYIAGTGSSWKVHSGGISANSLYDGEIFDPASESAEYFDAAYDTDDTLTGRLKDRLSLPVTIHEEKKPVRVIHTPADETVLDFGQNFAGILRVHVNEPEGTMVHLQFGEELEHGNFYRDNLRDAKAEFIYYSDGTERTVEQEFTYYGFRYVRVQGVSDVDPDDFTGLVLYSDLEMTGSVTTDNSKINQLISNCVWGQRSNFVDVPTDCPQRDERLGWTGDAQVFSGTACFNMDSYAFLNKYLTDIYMTQKELGCVTNFIPTFQHTEPTSCAWGDVATILPWNLYMYYGDKDILRRQFESMKMWADYMYSKDLDCGGRGLWITKSGFGDWLALDNDDPKERYCGGTDLTFLHTAYYFYSTSIVAKAAAVLERKDEEKVYAARADKIKKAFIRRFFTPDGLLAVNTQTAYAVALYMGLCPEDAVQLTADTLAEKIINGGGTLKTGFIGTPILCRVLSQNGYSDIAYRLLFNEDDPSWLYAVNLGATTIWERWNSLNPDGTFNGTDMNSLNHYSYGSIVEWIYRHVIGIQPVESAPGFKKAIIAPELNKRMKSADAKYISAAGEYRIFWTVTDPRRVHLEINVPFDATAELHFPGSDRIDKLCSGQFSFDYELETPLWEPVSADTNFADLREDPAATSVLDKYMPGWKDFPPIFTSVPLRDLADDPYLNVSEETIELIVKELQ